MCIISEYDITSIGDGKFICASRENPICPFCGRPLKYRDRRWRIMLRYGRKATHVQLRRLYCGHCRRLHLELPDCLVPRKHYALEVIENVVDGVSTPDDETTESYPVERTMERWKAWIAFNTDQINGWLKSIGYRFLGIGEAIFSTSVSLLATLRKDGAGWLATCERAIYNVGGSLLVKPLLAVAPALV